MSKAVIEECMPALLLGSLHAVYGSPYTLYGSSCPAETKLAPAVPVTNFQIIS